MLKEIIVLSEKAKNHRIAVPTSSGNGGVVKSSGAEATLS